MLPNARSASDSTRIVHSLADMFHARMFVEIGRREKLVRYPL